MEQGINIISLLGGAIGVFVSLYSLIKIEEFSKKKNYTEKQKKKYKFTWIFLLVLTSWFTVKHLLLILEIAGPGTEKAIHSKYLRLSNSPQTHTVTQIQNPQTHTVPKRVYRSNTLRLDIKPSTHTKDHVLTEVEHLYLENFSIATHDGKIIEVKPIKETFTANGGRFIRAYPISDFKKNVTKRLYEQYFEGSTLEEIKQTTLLTMPQQGGRDGIDSYTRVLEIGQFADIRIQSIENVTRMVEKNFDNYLPDNEIEYWKNGKKVAYSKMKEYLMPAVLTGKIPDGLAITYYDNGQIMRMVNFKDGQYHGEYKFYSNKHGNLYSIAQFENGKLHGMRINYYGNGQLRKAESFVNGEPIPSPIYKK